MFDFFNLWYLASDLRNIYLTTFVNFGVRCKNETRISGVWFSADYIWGSVIRTSIRQFHFRSLSIFALGTWIYSGLKQCLDGKQKIYSLENGKRFLFFSTRWIFERTDNEERKLGNFSLTGRKENGKADIKLLDKFEHMDDEKKVP